MVEEKIHQQEEHSPYKVKVSNYSVLSNRQTSSCHSLAAVMHHCSRMKTFIRLRTRCVTADTCSCKVGSVHTRDTGKNKHEGLGEFRHQNRGHLSLTCLCCTTPGVGLHLNGVARRRCHDAILSLCVMLR